MKQTHILFVSLICFILLFLFFSHTGEAIPMCSSTDACDFVGNDCDPGFECTVIPCGCPVGQPSCDGDFFSCRPCSDEDCNNVPPIDQYDYASTSTTITVNACSGNDEEISKGLDWTAATAGSGSTGATCCLATQCVDQGAATCDDPNARLDRAHHWACAAIGTGELAYYECDATKSGQKLKGLNDLCCGNIYDGAHPYDFHSASLPEDTWDSSGSCSDGSDNDCDGLIDCNDPDCDDRAACDPDLVQSICNALPSTQWSGTCRFENDGSTQRCSCCGDNVNSGGINDVNKEYWDHYRVSTDTDAAVEFENTGATQCCDASTDCVSAGSSCQPHATLRTEAQGPLVCDASLWYACNTNTRCTTHAGYTCYQTTPSTYAWLASAPAEVCDGVDNNCAAGVDEGCDDDNDDWCDENMVRASPYSCSGTTNCCPQGGQDCADGNPAINPGATDVTCNAVDEDCSGTAAPPTVCGVSLDITVAGVSNPVTTVTPPGCTAAVTATCSDSGGTPSSVTRTNPNYTCTGSEPNYNCGSVGDGAASVTCIGSETRVRNFDVSIEPDYCTSSCTGDWLLAGDFEAGTTSRCCGDDANENTIQKAIAPDSTWVPVTYATEKCCDAASDCADDTGCFSRGAVDGISQSGVTTWYVCSNASVLYECGPVHSCQSRESLVCHNDGSSWQWDAAPLAAETNCDDNTDNDCDGWIDEADADCAISLTLNPAVVLNPNASVDALFDPTTGNWPSGTKRLCDNNGCDGSGGCVNAPLGEICTTTGTNGQLTCAFTAPGADGLYGYNLCFGQNSAGPETLAVGSTCTVAGECPQGSPPACRVVGGTQLEEYGPTYDCVGNACTVDGQQVNQAWTCTLAMASSCSVQNCLGTPYTCRVSNGGSPEWVTSLGSESTCNDGYDNDCNSNVDCADAACQGTPGEQCTANPQDVCCGVSCCTYIGPEVCGNGIDEDCDCQLDNGCFGSIAGTVYDCSVTPRQLIENAGVRVNVDAQSGIASFSKELVGVSDYIFGATPDARYVVSAQAPSYDPGVIDVEVAGGADVTNADICLYGLACNDDCTDSTGLCNYECLGRDGCVIDDTPGGPFQQIADDNGMTVEEVIALLIDRCEGIPANTPISIPSIPEVEFICCGSAAITPIQPTTRSELSVESCSPNVIKIQRLLNMDTKGYIANFATYNKCE